MDGSSSKETSSRRSCREGNRPQPLEVASLLKLAATNVLFPVTAVCGTAVGCVRVSLSQRRLSSPHRWSFASTLLAFQSQPAMHFLQTIGILAVPLIVGRRNVLTVTALPQTKSRWKSRFPRRRGISGAMVDEFHGRSCSHWIRPNGCPEPFGHFFLNGLTLGQFARRKPGSYIGDMRQNSPSVADPRTAGISRSIDSSEGNSGKQTTKEIQ